MQISTLRPGVAGCIRHSAPSSPGRGEAESFVAAAYRQAFGARLRHFYPDQLEYRLDDGGLVGVTGIRFAARQALFVEHYLPRPIECMIGDHTGPVARGRVIEVGNFAVAARAWIRPFFTAIGAWVDARDIDWIAFTLTRPLRRVFETSGVPLLDFGAAYPALLPDDDDWGRYYDFEPRVMAVPVRDGLAQLKRPAQGVPAAADSARAGRTAGAHPV